MASGTGPSSRPSGGHQIAPVFLASKPKVLELAETVALAFAVSAPLQKTLAGMTLSWGALARTLGEPAFARTRGDCLGDRFAFLGLAPAISELPSHCS